MLLFLFCFYFCVGLFALFFMRYRKLGCFLRAVMLIVFFMNHGESELFLRAVILR